MLLAHTDSDVLEKDDCACNELPRYTHSAN